MRVRKVILPIAIVLFLTLTLAVPAIPVWGADDEAAKAPAPPATCRVMGTLVTESGRAVPKGNVSLARVREVDGKDAHYGAETDDKGAFAFDRVVPGAYLLTAIGPYLNVVGGEYRRDYRAMDVDVLPGQAEQQVRVRLLPWRTKVRVTLLDPEGKPVGDASAYVQAFERYSSGDFRPKTDREGVFESSCDPQQTRTFIVVVPARQLWARFTFKPGEDDKVLAVTAKCTLGGTLAGRVVEKGTDRVAGGIYVWPKAPGFTEAQPFPLVEDSPERGEFTNISRDGDGVFRMVLPTGDYTLRSEDLQQQPVDPPVGKLPSVKLDGDGASQVRDDCVTILLELYLWRAHPLGHDVLLAFMGNPARFAHECTHMIAHCRNMLTVGPVTPANPEQDAARGRSLDLVERILKSTRSQFVSLRAAHEGAGYAAWPKEDAEKARALGGLVAAVATQLYFSSGAYDEEQGKAEGRLSDEQKRRYYAEAAMLFDLLADTDVVHAAHDLVRTLRSFIPIDPKGVLLRIARVVRAGRASGLQYESLAHDVIVAIIERYLAEYRHLFKDDPECRAALIDVLDTFVGVGWPKARRLVYRLRDIYR